MAEFENVLPALNLALAKRGYTDLTPVQEAILDPKLRDADLLVSAQTGSGKTIAFGLSLAPTLLGDAEKFEYAPAPLALVVAPTRELALQVKSELDWLYAATGAFVASCVGGMDIREERRSLQRGAHIVVGTPGRLRDHIERGSLNTTGFRAIVLDEADEMLDLGFREDLEYILDAAPDDRRTLMFSATVPQAIAKLAKHYQRNAVRVQTSAEREQHADIEYRALTIAPNDRENAIVNVLRYFEPKNALVFCGTRMMVNHMTSRFTNRGISVVALSGELTQGQRTHALQAMRDGRAQVCIATDVAARGIDLPNLELVIHAELPKNKDSLLHRSGRTGRAGRKGICTLIVPHNLRRRTERLLQDANIKAAWAKPPSIDDIMKRDRERILENPMLSEALTEDEQTFASELVARHGAEQAAAAFLRLYRAARSAPEELIDAAPRERDRPGRDRPGREKPGREKPGVEKNIREAFGDSVWIRLSVGREQNAEPRWLLPMLCRSGHLTKSEIGAIRIQAKESFVELKAECIDRFFTTLGPAAMVEETISAKKADGPPRDERAPDRDKPRGPKRAEKEARKPSSRSKRYEKFDGGDKPRSASRADRPSREDKPDRPGKDFRRERPKSQGGPGQDKPGRDKPGRDKSYRDKASPKSSAKNKGPGEIKRVWTKTRAQEVLETAEQVYARRASNSEQKDGHDQVKPEGAALARVGDRKKKEKKGKKNKDKKARKFSVGGKTRHRFEAKPAKAPPS
jgi:ATP-dependent RNA helicase DeaD